MKKKRGVCYWKGLVTQAELFTKKCKSRQQFKKRKTLYGHLPPKNIVELKRWDMAHLDLIDPYRKYIRQQHTYGTVILNNDSINCMTMIDPATGWFEIVNITTLGPEEVTIGNDEYIDKSSTRVSQFLTTHGYADTHINAKSCLKTVLSLNDTSLL